MLFFAPMFVHEILVNIKEVGGGLWLYSYLFATIKTQGKNNIHNPRHFSAYLPFESHERRLNGTYCYYVIFVIQIQLIVYWHCQVFHTKVVRSKNCLSVTLLDQHSIFTINNYQLIQEEIHIRMRQDHLSSFVMISLFYITEQVIHLTINT